MASQRSNDGEVVSALKDIIQKENAKTVKQVEALLKKQESRVSDLELRVENGSSGHNLRASMSRESRSRASSRARSMMREGDEVLDAVTVGDLLVLHDTSELTKGFLMGDIAEIRCGVQQQPGEERTAFNFDDYTFRIVPQLTYRQKNELEALQKTESESSGRKLSRSASMGGDDNEAMANAILRQRVKAEENANAAFLEKIVEGYEKTPIKYGSIVQLQHVKSKLFLTVREEAAPFDPECRTVSLEEGSSAACFKLMPRFKAQTEGSIVYYSHSLIVESVKQRGMFVHTSPISYHDLPDPTNPVLPRNLQSGQTFEINLSPQASTFTVHKFARFSPEETRALISGTFFRLYHSQSEAFVQASCNTEKHRVDEKREGGLPVHVPYLKALADLGDDPDPADPFNHNSKGVWSLEPLSRTMGSAMKWDAAVRVRHVASGKYLAVDTDQPFKELNTMNEEWYSTYLVDDEAGEGDIIPGTQVATPEQMTFYISSADATEEELIPCSDVAIRLEHRFRREDTGDSAIIYFHNSEIAKPRKISKTDEAEGVITKSFQIVFSTVRSAQDIFKIMIAKDSEVQQTRMAVAFMVPVNLYSYGMALKVPISLDFYQATIRMMLKLLGFLQKGSSVYAKTNWIKKANETLPAAFSMLFSGDAAPFPQKICRDMKLFDAVFRMGISPYIRTHPAENPFESEDMEAPKAIQKFVHVALQRMFYMNGENQSYFGRRTCDAIDEKGEMVPRPWMDIILDQLEAPLGPAVTLSELLSSNEELMHKYASPQLVNRFAEMIQQLGPQPRLVNFFSSICTVDGVAVKANQEMILRLVWMNEKTRNKTLLSLHAYSPTDIAPAQYRPVRSLSGMVLESRPDPKRFAKFPKEYIAREEHQRPEGFDKVYISWNGSDQWSPKQGEALFWSAKALAIPTKKAPDGQQVVALEDFAWVLNAKRLCKIITGVSWETFLSNKEKDPKVAATFQRQKQLADFFVGQLNLHAKMCTGRSYNCIEWMERSYPYTMLVELCMNVHLPHQIRGAACDFARVLYLDRYPQLRNCGRPSLPESLWVYEVVRKDVDLTAIPVIRDLVLKEDGSLPEFKIPPSHEFAKHENPFFSFPTGFKFFLLRHLTNEYLASFGSGTVVHREKSENELAGSMLRIVEDLLSFGFQSSHVKIKALLKNLVNVLDGRGDVARLQFISDDSFEKVPFEPLEGRYELTSESPAVTRLKTVIIRELITVADIRANFRMGKLLHNFKESYAGKSKFDTELRKFNAYAVQNKTEQYSGPLNQKLFDDFEALFMTGDGHALDLDRLADTEENFVNSVLVDCLMYEDDALFATALQLLDRTFGQRRQLIESTQDIILLHRSSVPVFDNVATMLSQLGYLIYLVRSTEVWGVSSRVSGPFGPDKYELVLSLCDRIIDFMHAEPFKVPPPEDESKSNKKKKKGKKGEVEMQELTDGSKEDEQEANFHFQQNVLRSVNLHATLVESLKINYNISFMGSICSPEDKIKSREYLIETQRRLVQCMVDFVKANPRNQKLVFKHLPALRKHLGSLKLPSMYPEDFTNAHKAKLVVSPGINTEAVIIECIRNNFALCAEAVPRDLIETFGELLNKEPDPSASPLLEFFEIVSQPNGGKVIPRNQDYCIDVLLSSRLENLSESVATLFGMAQRDSRSPERLARALATTIKNANLQTASKMQAKRYTIEATLTVLNRRLEAAKANKSPEEHGRALLEDGHFCAMVEMLELQMDVLVIDPKLLRRDETWLLVSFGAHRYFAAAAEEIFSQGSLSPERIATVKAMASSIATLLDSARSLGLVERESLYAEELLHSQNSVVLNASALLGSKIAESTPAFMTALTRLVTLLDPSKLPSDEDRRRSTNTHVALDSNQVELPVSKLAAFKKHVPIHPTSADVWMHQDDNDDDEEEAQVDLSDLGGYLEPATKLQYFTQALTHNPLIRQKLQKRRFQFVDLLERAEEVVKIGVKPDGSSGPLFGCDVTWDKIVDRMVNYLSEHNYDNDEAHCIRIIRAFKSHVLKARSTEDGKERDVNDLEEEELEEYRAKQANLDSHGVTTVALTAISTHSAHIEGNLADEAIELLKELLNGGNKEVQGTVHNFVSQDKDLKLLQHLQARMLFSLTAIRERKEAVVRGYKPMDDEALEAYQNAEETFELFQLLSEGHNHDLQEILRDQPMHSGNLNLLSVALDMFVTLADSNQALRRMENAEIRLMCTALEALTELVQGPCSKNQELIVSNDSFLASLDKIIQSPFHSRVSRMLRLEVKNCTIQLMSSCLEGRSDRYVHDLMGVSFEPGILDMFQTYLVKSVLSARSDKVGSEEDRQMRQETATHALVALRAVIIDLYLNPVFKEKHDAVLDSKKTETLRRGADPMTKEAMRIIGTVEVAWDGIIESVSFPLPEDTEYLTQDTRNAFLADIDLSTAEKRMKQLIKEVPNFMTEMAQIYKLAQSSTTYQYIHENITSIKWAMYGLVVMLNLNIVMASYGTHQDGRKKDEGYESAISGAQGLDRQVYWVSLLITFVLGICNFCGYLVIVLFLGLTEVPIIIHRTDEYIAEMKADPKVTEYYNLGAFTWWGVTLGFNVLFIIMHISNYPDNPNPGLYLFLVLGVNLPWTLSCIRNYLVVPETNGARLFVIFYDTLVLKPFFRNHVVLMAFSILGFNNSPYFTLMLLDILNNSSLLGDIIKAITVPGAQLGLVFYLFVVTVIIYAQFGLEYFEKWFVYDGDYDDDTPKGCHSVVSCFFLIFYNGVPAGELSGVMDVIDNGDNDFLPRFIFDLSFFVWVGVLLFNIITGLMIDTFASLREEAAERADTLENECFVCGFQRSSYDDLNMVNIPPFDTHRDTDHAVWTYAFFIAYLRRRDPTEYTGVETYVVEKLAEGDLSWIPSRRSFAIHNDGAEMEEDLDEVEVKLLHEVIDGVEKVSKDLSSVSKRLSDVESTVKSDI